MQVHIVPCLKDNYAFLIRSEDQTLLIDAPEAAPILKFLDARGWSLSAIWITHGHWDHVQGIPELKEKYDCLVREAHDLKNGQGLDFGSERAQVFSVPGHTLDQKAFFFPSFPALFPGDTLFSMGCGRVFEGTHEQLFTSLQALKGLPKDTHIFPGHEYTLKNALFAEKFAPTEDVLKRLAAVRHLRDHNLPSIPVSLDLELKTNPFLRSPTLTDFTRLRELRDQW